MRPGLLVVAITALALVSAASAKNLTLAQVCGVDACAPLQDRQAVTSLLGGSGSQAPPTAGFYRLDFTFESPDGTERRTHSSLYVPSKQLAATEGRSGDVVWFPVDRAAVELVGRAARDVKPFPALAAWPTSFADPVFTAPTRRAAGDGNDPLPWLVGVAALLLAVATGAFFARRLRFRRPTPA